MILMFHTNVSGEVPKFGMCHSRTPVAAAWPHWTGVQHLLVHGHGGMDLIDQAVGPGPFYTKMYSYSTVDYRNLCGIRELYDLDFCGIGVLILGAALHAGQR